ncbi:helix-turn-helix transcriptional regulator [Parasphaerochaeta coccoides]|uniref:YheO-like domain-containing protein n=1 Tax=Parasphaerochaeta coccoides (strain ATCC BAA-1237 / DSM 17374 / SPN1) TaxID=760011 RepID=F4GHI7_PARC1|nr:PAS domain-containing protein [Parasphaerochaeta coccoides]AEC02576.1 YheO-like domain-containing protein [Parasphaerochaeta coccoides DSM 17374]
MEKKSTIPGSSFDGVLKYTLSQTDWALIDSTKAFMHSLDELLGSDCEVVVHVWNPQRREIVIHSIINGHVTERKKNGPLITQDMEVFSNETISNEDVIDSYYTRTKNGKIIKSISTLLRNAEKEPIAIFCINVNLSAPMISWINRFSPSSGTRIANNGGTFPPFPILSISPTDNKPTPTKAANSGDSKETIPLLIDETLAQMTANTNISSSNIKKDMIEKLYLSGIFELKGAIEIVAGKLGLSRFTIYHYLREVKQRTS